MPNRRVEVFTIVRLQFPICHRCVPHGSTARSEVVLRLGKRRTRSAVLQGREASPTAVQEPLISIELTLQRNLRVEVPAQATDLTFLPIKSTRAIADHDWPITIFS